MHSRPLRSFGLAAAFVLVLTLPAQAGSTPSKAPDTVDLKRGTSTSTEAQALVLVADDDDQFYGIAPKKKNGKFGIRYIVTFADVPPAVELSLQIRAETNLEPCNGHVALYRWKTRTWVGDTTTITTTEDFASFDPTKARPFIKNGRVKGRVKCSSKLDFNAFSTDHVRLIVD